MTCATRQFRAPAGAPGLPALAYDDPRRLPSRQARVDGKTHRAPLKRRLTDRRDRTTDGLAGRSTLPTPHAAPLTTAHDPPRSHRDSLADAMRTPRAIRPR